MPSTSSDNRRKTLNNFGRAHNHNGICDNGIIMEQIDQDQFDCENEEDAREKLIEFIRANRRDMSCHDDDTNLGQLVLEKSQHVADKFIETMASVAEKWAYLGLNRYCIEKRLDSILGMVLETCSDAEKWEDELVSYLEKEKILMLKNLKNLTKELELGEYEPPQGGGFMDILNDILERHEELQFIKKERLAKWTELHSQHVSLTKKLGLPEESHALLGSSIPSERAIQDLQTKVLDFKKIHQRRHKAYLQNKKCIIDLADDLEMAHDSCEVAKFTGNEDQTIVLSETFLQDQEAFMRSLQKLFSANEKTKEKLMERLTQLWNILDLEERERNRELHGIVNWKPSDLEKLTKLVNKYEEIKRQNIGKFIEKLRDEIREYWGRCYSSQEDRDAFEIYMTEEDSTEALLTAHEDELSRLKAYYQENKKLFELFEQWKICWFKYLKLEEDMNNPNRFNNRGGVLLKQEKEKKRTQKELTKCEKDIRTLSENWSANNNDLPFLIEGQPIVDFIEYQKTNYQETKENQKKERLKSKNELEAKTKRVNSQKPTPNMMHRTPGKPSASNTPASALGSADVNRRLQNSAKPLSPVNRDLRMARTRTQTLRLAAENKIGSMEKSYRPTPSRDIKATPQGAPTIICSSANKKELGQLIGEEQFRALLQDRKHETLESTGLSKISPDESPLNQTFRKENASKITRTYGALSRRKSRSYTVLSLKFPDDPDEPLYCPTTPKLQRCGSSLSTRSNKSLKSNKSFKSNPSSVFSPRPPFRV